MVQAWKYNERDRILHFLPLYHVHGLLNKLLCLLDVGGRVDFVGSAKAEIVWARLAGELQVLNQAEKTAATLAAYRPITLFMAVPTVYAKMIEAERSGSVDKKITSRALKILASTRFMACGSAALPDSILRDWETLTGQTLVERYGMTELGMVLTNPVSDGERRIGTVG
eukprot:gene44121-54829_t